MARVPRKTEGVTLADLATLPENVVGEIIDGELVVSPRPAPAHAVAGSVLGGDLVGSFGGSGGGSRGPGGWWIIDEPELHLDGHVLVPDLAGWRRERLPSLRGFTAFTVAPDWVCEIVSPSSVRRDRVVKTAIYASLGVPHMWLVDPDAQVVESYQLTDGRWTVAAVEGGAEVVRLPPFDAVELDLGRWWLPEEPVPENPAPEE